jgi:hypothetical protein
VRQRKVLKTKEKVIKMALICDFGLNFSKKQCSKQTFFISFVMTHAHGGAGRWARCVDLNTLVRSVSLKSKNIKLKI